MSQVKQRTNFPSFHLLVVSGSQPIGAGLLTLARVALSQSPWGVKCSALPESPPQKHKKSRSPCSLDIP